MTKVKAHLFSFAVSIVFLVFFAIGVFITLDRSVDSESSIQSRLIQKYENFEFKRYYPTFQNDSNEAYHALKYTLESGGVALLGSSELSNNKSRFTPYEFMGSLGINLRAFGHDGYQTKAILSELLSVFNKKVSENGQVVILLSPTWFASGEGMHEGLWEKEIATPVVKSRIRENTEISDDLKLAVLGRELIIGRFANFDNLFRKKNDEEFLTIEKPLAVKPPLLVEINWNGWKKEAIQFELEMSSNEYGINDEYFAEHVKPRIGTSKFPFKVSTGVSIEKNNEIQDFKVLLKFLDQFKLKPLFVILPLNRKAYNNLHELNAEMDHVESLINEKQFPLLNFWTAEPEPGILTDVMHTGAMGWVLINQFIYLNVNEN